MGFNCLKATESLKGDSLRFNTQSPGIPGTHLIHLRKVVARGVKQLVALYSNNWMKIGSGGLKEWLS